jgi:hypothetical protein
MFEVAALAFETDSRRLAPRVAPFSSGSVASAIVLRTCWVLASTLEAALFTTVIAMVGG